MKTRKFLSIVFMVFVFGATSFAQKTAMVIEPAMYPSKNNIENVVNAEYHITKVARVKADV